MSIAERLKQARMTAGYETAADAARAHNWSPDTYRSYENGHRGVARKWLITFSKAFKVDVAWLLTGQMATPKQQHAVAAEIGQVAPIVEWGKLPIERSLLMVFANDERARARRFVSLGKRLESDDLFAITVKDTAMVHPTDGQASLYPGDDAVVEVSAVVKPGKLAFLYDPESREHCFRKATYPNRKTVVFVPANPDFPSITMPADSPHILGVVVAIQRNIT